jgi:hypothetical protein
VSSSRLCAAGIKVPLCYVEMIAEKLHIKLGVESSTFGLYYGPHRCFTRGAKAEPTS